MTTAFFSFSTSSSVSPCAFRGSGSIDLRMNLKQKLKAFCHKFKNVLLQIRLQKRFSSIYLSAKEAKQRRAPSATTASSSFLSSELKQKCKTFRHTSSKTFFYLYVPETLNARGEAFIGRVHFGAEPGHYGHGRVQGVFVDEIDVVSGKVISRRFSIR